MLFIIGGVVAILLLAIGVVLVVSKAKKLEAAPVLAVETKPEAADDDPYVKQVRDLVEKS